MLGISSLNAVMVLVSSTVIVFFVQQVVASPTPTTLADCIEAAKKQSETIAISSEDIEQADSRYRQAIGALLPTLSATASYLVQETPSSGSTVFSPSSQPLVKVSLSQPLFRGFREFAALRYAKTLSTVQSEAKKHAMRQLLLDVAQSYFLVLSTQKDLKHLSTQIGLYDKRLGELKERLRIGRSRATEVLSVEALKATLKSQIAQIEGQHVVARQMLQFLTGFNSDVVLTEMPPPEKLEPLDHYTDKLLLRPDIRMAEKKLSAAHENVTINQGAHFPSIDLVGNYYPKRSGTLENVHWDIQLAASIPIFSGGIIQSKVSEARSQVDQAELSLMRTKRLAHQQISELHQTVEFDLKQIHELSMARDIARKHFDEQTKDYRLGLVTNLEVLAALSGFQENDRYLDKLAYTTKLDELRLLIAAGHTNLLLANLLSEQIE